MLQQNDNHTSHQLLAIISNHIPKMSIHGEPHLKNKTHYVHHKQICILNG